MISQNLSYSVGDRAFAGYLAFDERRASKRAGILVFHEGDGLGAHTKARADMLAALGYVAFAPDLYGEAFSSREVGIAAITALVGNPAVLRRRAMAALAALQSLEQVDAARTAAIGFCFGGLVALELARAGADVGCVVSFHGGLQTRTPASEGDIKCKVLVCVGAEDPFVTQAQRAAFEDEMRNAKADWQLAVYAHARHAFTNAAIDPAKSPGSAYHQRTDERSWAAMRALFDEALG